jgi:hypothetical protein
MMQTRRMPAGKMRMRITPLGIHLRMGTTVGTTVVTMVETTVGTSWIYTLCFLRGMFEVSDGDGQMHAIEFF